jgi:hypothetical protein
LEHYLIEIGHTYVLRLSKNWFGGSKVWFPSHIGVNSRRWSACTLKGEGFENCLVDVIRCVDSKFEFGHCYQVATSEIQHWFTPFDN